MHSFFSHLFAMDEKRKLRARKTVNYDQTDQIPVRLIGPFDLA
jgi:hypothetical protein